MGCGGMKMSLLTLVAGAALATVFGGARTALALNSQQASDQYLHDVWTTEDGLPQNSITSIVQT